ncbi:hypothetical protein [Acidiplasma sp.]|uniref:hypothetical protein n=1 Tax=Acidiplasma sp. TaxID=1872114 RepID=UPI002586713B|nr:hypothetical protein [Acidiplasma sp.]
MKDEMDSLLANVLNYSKKMKLNVYYSIDVDIVISFEWDKRMGNWKNFLDTCRANNVHSIVLSVKRFQDEDIDLEYTQEKKLFNKIAELDIMYIVNDVGYKYHEEAPEFTELNTFSLDDLLEDTDEKKVLPLNKEVNEKSVDTLTQEMLKYINDDLNGYAHYNMDDAIKSFWQYKGINLDFWVEPEIKNKIDKVNKNVKKVIEKEDSKKERQKLYNMIPDLLEKLFEKNKSNITLDDVKDYLAEQNVKVKYKINITSLYRQVLKAVKLNNGKQ